MLDLTSPESTFLIVNTIALTLTQLIKSLAGLEDRLAQALAFAIGGGLGALWFAAWSPELVPGATVPQTVLGYVLCAIVFAAVPSGAYKLAAGLQDRGRRGG